ncbi:hypothetical protein H5410_055523 [Solanum commersonii]|uniref:Uncharacterized protein n=1 Tax=Solanum commersonii TaxID=4109 RepID=A0A9J5WIZ0_SOLCO|nr:hypothetical protein H5410_055523 [Solanum commersonii]
MDPDPMDIQEIMLASITMYHVLTMQPTTLAMMEIGLLIRCLASRHTRSPQSSPSLDYDGIEDIMLGDGLCTGLLAWKPKNGVYPWPSSLRRQPLLKPSPPPQPQVLPIGIDVSVTRPLPLFVKFSSF